MIRIPGEILRSYCYHYDRVAAGLRPGDPGQCADLRRVEFVFLCFTNRCGSNFVAEAVASDGRLNLAWECWNSDEILATARRLALPDFATYFAGIALNDAREGRFLSKLGLDHLTLLHQTGALEAVRDRATFILVDRADKLGQAISMSIAEGANWWISYQEPQRPLADLRFNRQQIDSNVDRFCEQSALFGKFFALNGIAPLAVTYEHFAANPRYWTALLGRGLGIPHLTYRPRKIRLGRQTSRLNGQWRSMYLEGVGAEA